MLPGPDALVRVLDRRIAVSDASDRVARERENFVACYRALTEAVPGGLIREGAGTFAFVTGLPVPMFNGCLVTNPDRVCGVGTILGWLAELGVPHTLWVPAPVPTELEAMAVEHGLAREPHPYPGMLLNPIPPIPTPPPGVVVEPVDGTSLAQFSEVVTAVGLGAATAAHLTAPSFVDREDVDLFLGYLDGSPVGTSVAVSSARAGGVVNVLTREEARGRGVGTAMTWAAVQAGAARGHDSAVLQATVMGLPVYRAMGFETVTEYVEFVGPA